MEDWKGRAHGARHRVYRGRVPLAAHLLSLIAPMESKVVVAQPRAVETCASPGSVEIQYMAAVAMGADATIQDWIRFKQKCAAWSVPFAALFTEWLKQLVAGQSCGSCDCGPEELSFVREHATCMAQTCRAEQALTICSVLRKQHICDLWG